MNIALCFMHYRLIFQYNFLETDTCPFDQEFVYLCTKKFVTVYQEIVVFIISKIV